MVSIAIMEMSPELPSPIRDIFFLNISNMQSYFIRHVELSPITCSDRQVDRLIFYSSWKSMNSCFKVSLILLI